MNGDFKCSEGKWENRTQLADLNVDCQFLILEKLLFRELLNMATTSKAFSSLASDVFKRKFADKLISIENAFKKSPNDDDDDQMIIIDTLKIKILQNDVALLMVEHFGSSILKLEINYDFDQMGQTKRMVKHVNQYCDNLKEFQLRTSVFVLDALKAVKKPFKHVIDVKLFGVYQKIGNEAFNLNEMFPALRRLSLWCMRLIDHTGTDVLMPQLDSLDIWISNYAFTSTEVTKLIMKNPQIRTIQFHNVDASFVDFLSKHMPNLEIVSFPRVETVDYIGNIHFNGVKKFICGGSESKHFHFERQLLFEHLNEFECFRSDYPWLGFIRNHPNITKLNMRNVHISSLEISLITDILPHLIEAMFCVKGEFDVNLIVRFMAENENLNKFQFNTYPVDMNRINELSNRVTDQWTYVSSVSDKMYHSFERKHLLRFSN